MTWSWSMALLVVGLWIGAILVIVVFVHGGRR